MRAVAAALITTDAALRAAIEASGALEIASEVALPVPEVTLEHLQALQVRRPEVVVLDLGEESELGLRLVQYMVEALGLGPVLAVGPEPSAELLFDAMQAGVGEYLVKPVRAEAVRGAMERLRRRFGVEAAPGPEGGGRVYAITGAKGGVGATLVATSLAMELRRLTGESVLLSDMDFLLGDAAVHLHMTPRFDVADVIENLGRMDAELLASFLEAHESGVKVLSSPVEVEKAALVDPEQVGSVLRLARGLFRHTVVDSPWPFAPHAAPIFAEADEVVLVTTPDVPSLRNVGRVLPALRRGEEEGRARVRLVVNRYDPSRSVGVREIEQLTGVPVLGTVRSDYGAVLEAINAGVPIGQSQKSPVARDLRVLAAAVAGEVAARDGGKRGRFGPLARLRERGLFGRREGAERDDE